MKQLTKQTPATSNISVPKPSRSTRQAVPHTPLVSQSTPDVYKEFIEEASSEAKDAFYHKLAGILLKKAAG